MKEMNKDNALAAEAILFNVNDCKTWEWILGGAILLLIAVCRCWLTGTLRVDSDEPQHLHMVWAWTQGLLPYRDVFDNHTPLFHILFAPLLQALGERPDILEVMRLAMLPLYAGSLFALYQLGRAVFGTRTAWWAVVVTGCEARFFFPSLEFRADTLWTFLWLAALWILLTGERRPIRLFCAGLLAGAAVCTSIKTILLLASFGLATLCWIILHLAAGGSLSWKKWVSPLAAFALGAALLPACVTGYFWTKGGLAEMIYCLFRHNVDSADNLGKFQSETGLLPGLLCVVIPLLCYRRTKFRGIEFRPAFLLLGIVFFYGLVIGYFSRLTPLTSQTFLPALPLLILLVIEIAHKLSIRWWAHRLLRIGPPLAISILLIISWCTREQKDWLRVEEYRRYLRIVLALTKPDDFVMDAKGESVYRQRSYYFCLEAQTLRKLAHGTLDNNIVERLASTRTVLVRLDRLPANAKEFVLQNYLPVGHGAYVLGKKLSTQSGSGANFNFTIAVGETYQIVGKNYAVSGNLNNTPYVGVAKMMPGAYTFTRTSPDEALILLLSRAVEKGLVPKSSRK